MQLSPHFQQSEFEKDGPMPAVCVGAYTALCETVLEPLREHFGQPIVITSGYRSPEANKAAGGAPDSQHIATAADCAADFKIEGYESNLRYVFDWIRLQSRLPIDQLILEADVAGGPGVILHASWAVKPRYMALEGLTHNAGAYTSLTYTKPEDWSA